MCGRSFVLVTKNLRPVNTEINRHFQLFVGKWWLGHTHTHTWKASTKVEFEHANHLKEVSKDDDNDSWTWEGCQELRYTFKQTSFESFIESFLTLKKLRVDLTIIKIVRNISNTLHFIASIKINQRRRKTMLGNLKVCEKLPLYLEFLHLWKAVATNYSIRRWP